MFADASLNPSLCQPQDTRRKAAAAFETAYLRGLWDKLVAALTGRAHGLQGLPAQINAGHFAGARVVPVAKVRGSENRTHDFDADFHPLHPESRDRWISVYEAWRKGKPLPPVELVQVGETYYVRDGHHRLSVAHALRIDYVDALVTEAVLRSPR
jgi:hypothetical protein